MLEHGMLSSVTENCITNADRQQVELRLNQASAPAPVPHARSTQPWPAPYITIQHHHEQQPLLAYRAEQVSVHLCCCLQLGWVCCHAVVCCTQRQQPCVDRHQLLLAGRVVPGSSNQALQHTPGWQQAQHTHTQTGLSNNTHHGSSPSAGHPPTRPGATTQQCCRAQSAVVACRIMGGAAAACCQRQCLNLLNQADLRIRNLLRCSASPLSA